jgi:hypothetical protein
MGEISPQLDEYQPRCQTARWDGYCEESVAYACAQERA